MRILAVMFIVVGVTFFLAALNMRPVVGYEIESAITTTCLLALAVAAGLSAIHCWREP